MGGGRRVGIDSVVYWMVILRGWVGFEFGFGVGVVLEGVEGGWAMYDGLLTGYFVNGWVGSVWVSQVWVGNDGF